MTDMAGALGRVQLQRLPAFVQRRQQLAARYLHELKDLPLILPADAPPGDTHAWHLYVVRLRDDAPLERDAGGESVLDTVADDRASDSVGLTLSNQVSQLLEHGLSELNEREREVLCGRYGLKDREPETLEVLAERMGLTRERIRQIQQEALLKLRRRMARHGVDRDSVF